MMSQRLHWEGEITLLDYARRLCGIEVAAWEKARERMTRRSDQLAAVQDAVRFDMANYAGGVTWLDADYAGGVTWRDAEYDERQGPALRRGGLSDDEVIEQTTMNAIVAGIRLAACAGHCRITHYGTQLPPSLFADGEAAASLIASEMEGQSHHGGSWRVVSSGEAASFQPDLASTPSLAESSILESRVEQADTPLDVEGSLNGQNPVTTGVATAETFARGAGVEASSASRDHPAVWLVQEIGRRRSARPPEPSDREPMMLALKFKYPELNKDTRRALIKAIPESLKGKAGPKKSG